MTAPTSVPRRPLIGAAALAAGLAGVFAVLLVFRDDLPVMAVIAFFTPMISLFVIFVSGSIAFLAFGRYRVSPEPVFLWTGLACSTYALVLAFYFLLSPGLREGGGMIIGHSPGTAAWFWMLSRFLFTGLAFTAAAAGRPRGARRILPRFASWFAAVGLACLLIVFFEDRLPDMIGPGGFFTPLEAGGEGLLLPFMLAGSAVAILRYRTSGERLFVYLGYLLLLLAFGTAANLLARARYDFAWYAARLFPPVGFVVLLLEFFREYVRMYWSEQGRSRKLADVIAERERAGEALRDLNNRLEERVARQTAQIRDANRELEERIAERTAELREANEVLRDSRLAALNLMEDARRAQEEQERINRELVDTRNYLNNLLDYANAPVIVWDPAFKVTLFNRAFERMTGYAAADVVGSDLSLLFPAGSKVESLEKTDETLRGGHWQGVEIPIRRRDGEVRYVLWNSANVYAEDGRTLRATIAQGQDVTERLRVERSLKESEERYRTLFNGMTEGFGLHEIVCDERGVPVDYRFLDVNPAFERLTGLRCEEVVGRLRSEVPQLRNDDPKWVEIYGRVALSGEPVHFENYSPALREHYEVFAFRPAPYRFAVIFLTVTDRKRKEEDLRRLNRTLKAMSDSNHAILRADDEETYLGEVCRIVVEDCGYAMVWIGMAEDDEAKTVRPAAFAGFEQGYIESLRVSWADTERGRGPTGTAIRTGTPRACRDMLTDPAFAPWREEALKRGYASSLSLPLRGGGRVFGAVTIYSREPDAFSDDEIGLLGGLADDLSFGIIALRSRLARDRAEAAAAEGERRFQTIVKHSSAAFFLQDMELRYRWLYHPKSAVADESVTGKTDFDLYGPEEARFLSKHKRRVLASGEGARLEFRLKAGEDGIVQDIALEPYRNAAGEVRGVYGLSFDITAQKRAEEVLKRDRETFERLVEERTRELVDARRELEQTKRLSDIGTLAATVAHELRNPLAAINIASYNIARKAANPLIESHLATIRKKVTESDQIINNLLFYSRIKYPRYERTELDGLIAECLSLTDGRFGSPVTVRQALDGLRGAAVNADPLQLKEVFSNILNNAYDAIAEKNGAGMIEVRGSCAGGRVKIEVSDDGAGISEDHLEKLFEPFFTTKAKGTGLGLAVCRQIVTLHGGTIALKSTPGAGTTVEVQLPCVS